MSTYTILSTLSGAERTAVNTWTSSTWSHGRGSSPATIRSRPSLLNLRETERERERERATDRVRERERELDTHTHTQVRISTCHCHCHWLSPSGASGEIEECVTRRERERERESEQSVSPTYFRDEVWFETRATLSRQEDVGDRYLTTGV